MGELSWWGVVALLPLVPLVLAGVVLGWLMVVLGSALALGLALEQEQEREREREP